MAVCFTGHVPGQTRSFFRNAAIIGAAEIVVRLKSLVIIPLLTHRFGSLDYGAWAQVAVFVGLITPLVTLATESGIVRYLSGRDENVQRAWFTAWVLAISGAGVVIAVVVVVLSHPIAAVVFGSRSYHRFMPLAAASIVTTSLFSAGRTWLRVRNDARWFSGVTILQAIWSVGAVVFVLVRHTGPLSLVQWTLAGDTLLTAGMILRAWRGRPPHPDWSILPRVLRFGIPLVPGAFAVWGLNAMDRLFLVRYHGLGDVGVYALAYSMGYLVIQVLVNPVWTMYPNASTELHHAGEHDSVQQLFERSIGLILALVVPMVGATIVIGDLAIQAVAPPEFSSASRVIPIVVAGYLFTMLSSYFEVSLGLVHRQAMSTVAAVLAALVNLALNLLLIPKYGTTGAAEATAIAFGVQLTFTATLALRSRLVRVPWDAVRRVLLASATSTAALAAARYVLPMDGVAALCVLAVVGCLVYGALAVAFDVVPRDQLRLALDTAMNRVRPAPTIPS